MLYRRHTRRPSKAADAMQLGVKMCEEVMRSMGRYIGLGKNLVVTFLKVNGYDVIDLGKDVPNRRVVEEVI